jgi:hypothetical protein
MKATYHGQYFKNGKKMYTFKVTGTTEEITKYKAIQETVTNRGIGTWPEADGHPLYFLGVATLLRNGEIPQKQYNLLLNQDETRIIRDTSAQELANYERMQEETNRAQAMIMAEIRLGLRTVGATTPTITTPSAPVAKPAGAEAPDLADSILEQVGAGGEDLGGDIETEGK